MCNWSYKITNMCRGMITVNKRTLANTGGALMGLHGWSWISVAPILAQLNWDYPAAFKPLPSSLEISAISFWHAERSPVLTLASFYKNNLPGQRAVKSPQIKPDLPPITPLHLISACLMFCTQVECIIFVLDALAVEPEQHAFHPNNVSWRTHQNNLP